MAGDTRVGDRQPAILRIKLKYASVDTFIEKYAVNISRGGIFIASRTPKPVGTLIKFEFLLQQGETGTSIIRGEGQVQWVREFDPNAPQRPHGMGLRFTHLDAESQKLIDRALQWQNKHIAPIRRELSGVSALPERDKSAPNKVPTRDQSAPNVFPPIEPTSSPKSAPVLTRDQSSPNLFVTPQREASAPHPMPPAPVASLADAELPPTNIGPTPLPPEAPLARVALKRVAVARQNVGDDGRVQGDVDAVGSGAVDEQLAALCAEAGLDDAKLDAVLDRLRALGVSPDLDLSTLLT
jgi:uncharacterized protein (TIGR02266 family)